MVREAACAFPGFHLAIALDTKGPEVRTGTVDGDETKTIELKSGSIITVTTNESFQDKCSPETVYLDYKNFSKDARPGQRIFVDDGLMNFEVVEVTGKPLFRSHVTPVYDMKNQLAGTQMNASMRARRLFKWRRVPGNN